MKYLDIDDIRALELINAEVHDEKLKEKLIKIYMSDIRKKEHDYVRHDSRNISLCSSDSKQVTIIEYELSKDIEDSSAITMRNFFAFVNK